jgi:hypothetical protein
LKQPSILFTSFPLRFELNIYCGRNSRPIYMKLKGNNLSHFTDQYLIKEMGKCYRQFLFPVPRFEPWTFKTASQCSTIELPQLLAFLLLFVILALQSFSNCPFLLYIQKKIIVKDQISWPNRVYSKFSLGAFGSAIPHPGLQWVKHLLNVMFATLHYYYGSLRKATVWLAYCLWYSEDGQLDAIFV